MKLFTVKAADSLAAEATDHARNVVHIRFGDHRFHGSVDVVIGEFPPYMFVEESTKIGKLSRVGRRHQYFSFLERHVPAGEGAAPQEPNDHAENLTGTLPLEKLQPRRGSREVRF
jgi:hypothetical protein